MKLSLFLNGYPVSGQIQHEIIFVVYLDWSVQQGHQVLQDGAGPGPKHPEEPQDQGRGAPQYILQIIGEGYRQRIQQGRLFCGNKLSTN